MFLCSKRGNRFAAMHRLWINCSSTFRFRPSFSDRARWSFLCWNNVSRALVGSDYLHWFQRFNPKCACMPLTWFEHTTVSVDADTLPSDPSRFVFYASMVIYVLASVLCSWHDCMGNYQLTTQIIHKSHLFIYLFIYYKICAANFWANLNNTNHIH